jgi:hypothetical protein
MYRYKVSDLKFVVKSCELEISLLSFFSLILRARGLQEYYWLWIGVFVFVLFFFLAAFLTWRIPLCHRDSCERGTLIDLQVGMLFCKPTSLSSKWDIAVVVVVVVVVERFLLFRNCVTLWRIIASRRRAQEMYWFREKEKIGLSFISVFTLVPSTWVWKICGRLLKILGGVHD